MSHPERELLSACLDGDLAPGRRATVESHLAGCARCRGELRELRRLTGVLAALPDHPPERDLWPRIRSSAAASRSRHPPAGRWLAAAAAALLILGVAAWLATHRPVPASPGAAGGTAAARVAAAADGARAHDLAARQAAAALRRSESALDPDSTRLIRDELGVLDRALADLEQALEEDPGSSWLAERRARTARQRWTYLREAPRLAASRFAAGG